MDETSRKSRRRYGRFFGDLGTRLDAAKQADHRRYLQFFAELSPRLETAKALERDLDRHLARRFNVFDYLDTLEAGLSRIIADLLDPSARHGQGTLFLRTLLEALTEIRDRPQLGVALTQPIKVMRERVITNNRRLDISVEVSDGDGTFCLAIENKPYADDQRNQVKDYLAHLEREYSRDFLLIYLSPTGEAPDEWSLPKEELQHWHGRFAIMPYWGAAESADSERAPGDVFDDVRTGLSLADWLAVCRRRCDPDRLRWFLRDAEVFCQRRFGGRSMPSDSETRALRDYLFSNPSQLATAQAVHDVWPAIKSDLCKRFLEHLGAAIHERIADESLRIAPDIRVETEYRGEKGWANFLWVYRSSWPPWENHRKHPPYEGCSAIVMQSVGPGPNGWRWGVLHPLDKGSLASPDKERRTRLEEMLRIQLAAGRSDGWWPYLQQVTGEMADWNPLLQRLYRELRDGGGEITDYYVGGMMDIVTKAIPIIDEVERG